MNVQCRWLFSFFLFVAQTASAQTQAGELTVWFADGTGIEIRSLSTGANLPVSRGGSETIPAGFDAHRVVLEKQGKVLLGYDIEARKTGQGTFAVRLKPTNREQFKVYSWNVEEHIPTISGVREFPLLRVSDAVEMDIFYHPVTKERIYDVLRVLPGRQPAQAASKAAIERFPQESARVAGERLSLEDIRVIGDGKILREPWTGWRMSCSAFRIHIPEHGDYYLTLAPSPELPFQAAGWVDHNILRFHAGSVLVEIVGKTNVLKSDFSTVWVYHDPESGALAEEAGRLRQRLAEALTRYKATHPDVRAMEKRLSELDGPVNFTAGDSVAQLLALKKNRPNQH